ARETLDVSASIATAYDEDTRPQEPLPESSVTSRLFTVLTPMVVFTRHDSRVQLGVTAQSNFRYFGDIGQLTTMNHSVGAGLSMNVARHTSLFVNQSVAYSPGYLYGLFAPLSQATPGDSIPAGTDYYASSTNHFNSYSYATNAAVVQNLTRRASLEFDSGYRLT